MPCFYVTQWMQSVHSMRNMSKPMLFSLKVLYRTSQQKQTHSSTNCFMWINQSKCLHCHGYVLSSVEQSVCNLMFFWPCIMNWLYINYQLDALIIIHSQNTILLYMFRASSAHLQEDTVLYMQHMVLSLSMRVSGGLSVHSMICVLTRHQELS